MTRRDLTSALQRVKNSIIESRVIETIESVFTREGVEYSTVLDSFQKYSRFSSSFGDKERKIINIFHLDDLERSSFWQSIIAVDTEYYSKMNDIKERAQFLVNYLPDVLKLIEQEGVIEFSHEGTGGAYFSGKKLLTTILPEDDGKFSSPQRLVNVIESIEIFYSVCARLDGTSENDLAVIAIDSGSDKSLDFVGAAKIVECVKDTIIALWDRIVFYRERQQNERLDIIEKSLPLIERINNLEKEDGLSSEQAEIFRRSVFSGVHKFASSGAIIPELNLVSSYNPRKLMAPEPKLLVEKGGEDVNHNKSNSNSDKGGKQNFSEEEMRQLKGLLDKFKGSSE